MKPQRDVYIAGVGETKFGKHRLEFDALGRIAALQALKSSNIDRPNVIQSAYVGNGTNRFFTWQTVLKDLGMCGNMPIINVESACSAGGMAVHLAVRDIASGFAEVSLAIGCEN